MAMMMLGVIITLPVVVVGRPVYPSYPYHGEGRFYVVGMMKRDGASSTEYCGMEHPWLWW